MNLQAGKQAFLRVEKHENILKFFGRVLADSTYQHSVVRA
jgi:hypothetical protein